MKNDFSIVDYVKSIWWVGLSFLAAVYCVLACVFDPLKIPCIVSLSNDVIAKINDLLKNICLSYIAGVFFFVLSDTIPYLRRRKVALSRVTNMLNNISSSIQKCFLGIDVNISDVTLNGIDVYEILSGLEYHDDSDFYIPQQYVIEQFRSTIDYIISGLDFILSQELYLDRILYDQISAMRSSNDILTFQKEINISGNGFVPKEFAVGVNSVLNIYRCIKDNK